MKACMVQSMHVTCSEPRLQERYVTSCLSAFRYTQIDYMLDFEFLVTI